MRVVLLHNQLMKRTRKQSIGTVTEPTSADCIRYNDLLNAWLDRNTDIDNFDLQFSLIGLCDRFGWDIPADAK